MRKLIALACFAALMLAGGAAFRVHEHGSIEASIAFDVTNPVADGAVAFTVQRTLIDDTVYWVFNSCWDSSGNLLSTEDYPVLWPSWDSFDGGTYPHMFKLSGTHCEALVTIKPWTGQPIKGDSVLDYDA
jgi:hypothetical protein